MGSNTASWQARESGGEEGPNVIKGVSSSKDIKTFGLAALLHKQATPDVHIIKRFSALASYCGVI